MRLPLRSALLLLAIWPASGRAQQTIGRGTSFLVVDGPMLLALLPATQAEVDADTVGGFLKEGLADFQYYLSKAASELRPQGIQVKDFYTDSLALTWPDGTSRRFGVTDSAGVLYLIVSRDSLLGALTTGVASDMALICQTLIHLKRPTSSYAYCRQ